jgi:carbonic anhydrase
MSATSSSDCGAVKAVFEQRDLTRLPLTAKWLGLVEPAWKFLDPACGPDAPARYKGLICANVIAQLEHLKTHPEVARRVAEGALALHGWFYDILTGAVDEYDEKQRRFVPLEETAKNQ